MRNSRSNHSIPWNWKERRTALACARGLTNGRFTSEADAVRGCRAALARAGFGGRHTTEAIRHRIRTESRRLGKPPSRAYWTAAEDRVIDHFALAVVRHEYPDATAAAEACQRVLARHKRSFPRTRLAIAARLGERALKCGRKQIHVIWTPEELRLLNALARKVSQGLFHEVRDASRAFVAETARRRHLRKSGGPPVPVRTLDAVDRKLWHVARDTGLVWGFRDWSSEEDRVVDRFISRYSIGSFRSLRSAAVACLTALRRLDASRQKHPDRGRPYRRSFMAVEQHLNDRALKRRVVMPRFRRWDGYERHVVAGFVEGRLKSLRHRARRGIAERIQRSLANHGYQRTVQACRAEYARLRRRAAARNR